jgi:hypothetical protein
MTLQSRKLTYCPLDNAFGTHKNTQHFGRRKLIPAPTRMLQSESSNTPLSKPMDKQCQHPRVQIVARDEDSEFVECLECREVFEASEFKDMAIEESSPEEA